MKDNTGVIELIWFQGISWIEKQLFPGHEYLVFGKASFFNNVSQIAHPEIEVSKGNPLSPRSSLEPIYPTTEKLKARWLNGRAIGKLTAELLKKVSEKELPENLPASIIASDVTITGLE